MKKNVADGFNPYWVNFLNNSMIEWYSIFSHGFMCVGRKPHTFGNERHTICCRIIFILWRAQVVKGEDIPAQVGPKFHWELVRTVGLMLRMCEPLFSTGKCVVVDSVFCVANVIVELASKGVYVGSLIKKRWYCPKSVPGLSH